MALDLMIRGTGSNRAPNDHVGALPAEYEGWKVFLYGTPLVETAYPATTDLSELAGWIEGAGENNLLLYGDDAVFRLVDPEAIGTIWVTMGADRDGVRDVWRLRQQYAWLAKQKLALLVEPSEGGDKPDVDRLMRLTRAVQVLTFPASPAPTGPVWASAAPEPAAADEVPMAAPEDQAWTPAPALPEEGGLSEAELASLTAGAPAVELAPATESLAPEVAAEIDAPVPAPHEDSSNLYSSPATQFERGADHTMTNPQAEQAILQRYALVRERRTASARVQEVEAVINSCLKEIFVARFSAGVDAAAEFEARTKKLAEASTEYAQLAQAMARIEEELAKLAWLKDELEI
jgi:hypothetical protein